MKKMFYERLNELLTTKDMKPIDMANILNVTRSTISQYLSGKNEPRQERVSEIAEKFNVNEAWLLGFDVPMERTDKQELKNSGIILFSERLKEAMDSRNIKQIDLAKATNIQPSIISRYLKGEYEATQENICVLAKTLNVSETWLMGISARMERSPDNTRCGGMTYICVYGSIPAGMPLEAIEDIEELIEIPESWTAGNKSYIALKVKGDSMYPKYLEGDIVIILIQPDCESGQDCACYVNGYDATLKTVIKGINAITLKPINPNYAPVTYAHPGEVSILGVVKEIRRRV